MTGTEDEPLEALAVMREPGGEREVRMHPNVGRPAAGAIGDISEKHPGPVPARLSGWTDTTSAGAWTIEHACRHLTTSHPDETARILAELRE